MDLSFLRQEVDYQVGSRQSSSVSLSDLAQSHLQGRGANSTLSSSGSSAHPAPTLSGFRIPNLFGGTTPNGDTFQVPDLFPTPSQTPSAPNGAPFQIPNLFGPPSSSSTPAVGQATFQIPNVFDSASEGTGSEAQINLMSALTLADSVKSEGHRARSDGGIGDLENRIQREFESMRRDVMSQHTDLAQNHGLMGLEHSDPSPCARVLAKAWPQTVPRSSPSVGPGLSQSAQCSVQPFNFDTPSPDDIVKQAQSKLFRSS